MSIRRQWPMVVGFLSVILPASALGQIAAKGTITSQGSVDITKQPNILRVQVEVLARGPDIKQALANLKKVKDSALTRLIALSADKRNISFSSLSITSQKSAQQKQLEEMVAKRLAALGKKTTKTKKQESIMVSEQLVADVPIQAATQEKLLILALDLQEKIRNADLGGLKKLTDISPEEKEIIEEAKMMGLHTSQGPQKGEAVFAFVRKITSEEYANALAQAFQKARKQAAILAKASGHALGQLHHLQSESQSVSADESAGYNYYDYGYQNRMNPILNSAQDREATGNQPTSVTYRVAVNASFRIGASGVSSGKKDK